MGNLRYVAIAALLSGGLIAGCTTTGEVSSAGGAANAAAGDAQAAATTAFSAGPEQVVLDELQKQANGNNDKVRGTGWAVDTSDDGSVLLATVPYYPIANKQTGKLDSSIGFAKIFRNGSSAGLPSFTDLKTPNLLFGEAGAISGDGRVVAIGAPGVGAGDAGHVYCFAEGPNGWGKEEFYPSTFSATGPAGAYWGFSVALNETGSTMVFGAPGENGHGMVHYYLAPAGGWNAARDPSEIKGGNLGAGDPHPGDEFGSSVAISRDDSVIAVGAPGRDNGKGTVYLFVKPKGGWTAIQSVIPIALTNGNAGDRFGESVAVSADGSTIVVGADGENNGSGNIHFIRFDKSTGSISVTSTSSGSDTEERFGISVDVSADGKTVAAGGFANKDHTGEVVVFRSDKGDWNDFKVIASYAASKPIDPKQVEAFLGFSVALNRSGTEVAAGAPGYGKGAGNYFSFDLTK